MEGGEEGDSTQDGKRGGGERGGNGWRRGKRPVAQRRLEGHVGGRSCRSDGCRRLLG